MLHVLRIHRRCNLVYALFLLLVEMLHQLSILRRPTCFNLGRLEDYNTNEIELYISKGLIDCSQHLWHAHNVHTVQYSTVQYGTSRVSVAVLSIDITYDI